MQVKRRCCSRKPTNMHDVQQTSQQSFVRTVVRFHSVSTVRSTTLASSKMPMRLMLAALYLVDNGSRAHSRLVRNDNYMFLWSIIEHQWLCRASIQDPVHIKAVTRKDGNTKWLLKTLVCLEPWKWPRNHVFFKAFCPLNTHALFAIGHTWFQMNNLRH
jgi:hypothetical protein